jgi:hypothetical protein
MPQTSYNPGNYAARQGRGETGLRPTSLADLYRLNTSTATGAPPVGAATATPAAAVPNTLASLYQLGGQQGVAALGATQTAGGQSVTPGVAGLLPGGLTPYGDRNRAALEGVPTYASQIPLPTGAPGSAVTGAYPTQGTPQYDALRAQSRYDRYMRMYSAAQQASNPGIYNLTGGPFLGDDGVMRYPIAGGGSVTFDQLAKVMH